MPKNSSELQAENSRIKWMIDMHKLQQDKLNQAIGWEDKTLVRLYFASLYLKNDCYTEAIELLKKLADYLKGEHFHNSSIYLTVTTAIYTCKFTIHAKAISLIEETQKLLAENPNDIEDAKRILKKTRELLTSIDESANADLGHLETRVNWLENRVKINSTCHQLLQNIPAPPHDDFIVQLKYCVNQYKKHIDFINTAENKLYSSIETLLTASQNIIIQQKIHNTLLPEVMTRLVSGNLLSAYDLLKYCKQEAAKITRAEDVAKYQYTPPNYFDASLAILWQEVDAFQNQRNARIVEITAEIINKAAERRLNKFGSEPKFYNKEKKDLSNTIAKALANNWHKFYEQGVPQELTKSIDDIIFNSLKRTNIFTRYYSWTGADIWFSNIKLVQSSITDLINEYGVTINAAPVTINLPILPGLAEQYNNKLEHTIETLLLPKANAYIEKHQWQDAYDALELCKMTAQKITKVGDLSQTKYHSPADFEHKQNDLLPIIQVFNQRLQTGANNTARTIINNAVQSKCKDLGLGDKLYSVEARRLKNKLNSVLANNWYKFDGVEFPKELAESIHKIIYDDLKVVRVISKFFYWTDADVWFANISDVEAQIERAITEYKPRYLRKTVIDSIPIASEYPNNYVALQSSLNIPPPAYEDNRPAPYAKLASTNETYANLINSFEDRFATLGIPVNSWNTAEVQETIQKIESISPGFMKELMSHFWHHFNILSEEEKQMQDLRDQYNLVIQAAAKGPNEFIRTVADYTKTKLPLVVEPKDSAKPLLMHYKEITTKLNDDIEIIQKRLKMNPQ